MRPEDIDFSPSLKFMNNPFLFHLQQMLDSSISELYEPEKMQESLMLFEENLSEHIEQLCSQQTVDQTVEFLRHNLTVLDLGGMSVGRSKQDIYICAANERIIESIGEEKYFAIVREYEAKQRGGASS